jgi:hypothetical protein
MPPRKIPPEAPPAPEPTIEPPFYEATEDLYVGDPEAGSAPVLAYRAGDRVVPDVVEPNGWGGKVRIPAVFEGQLTPPPPPDPEATAPASQHAAPAAPEE